ETQLKNKDMGLEITDEAKRFLALKGYDPVLGARPLRRTIQREVEDPLSEKILFGELGAGQIVVVDCDGNPEDTDRAKLVFRSTQKPDAVPDAVPAGFGSTDPGPAESASSE
ncbi:MAG TPA: hypothetical protein VHJ83_14135, partial [Micromonosporaceae bacterium]|nr:hypothetical protein [Micromonosporaceae bacterium]